MKEISMVKFHYVYLEYIWIQYFNFCPLQVWYNFCLPEKNLIYLLLFYGDNTVLLSMLVSLCLLLLVRFPFSIQPLLYKPISLIFALNYITNISPRVVLHAQYGNEGWGGVGSHVCHGGVLGLSHETMLAHDLMYQPEARCWVSVRIPVPQGTGVSLSADRTWVQSRNRDYDSTIYPDPYVQNRFIHFAAMIWINCTSTTRAYLPSMPLK